MLAIPKMSIDRAKLNNLALAMMVVMAISGMLFYFVKTDRFGGGSLASLFSVTQNEEVEQDVVEETPIEVSGGDYIEEARAGEGLTHLARRAVGRYVGETGNEIGPERRVYAEDHIQKSLGGGPLQLGEEVSISRDLVVEAIDLSFELNGSQIENLEQYSSNVVFFY